jgi:hypothetical protein
VALKKVKRQQDLREYGVCRDLLKVFCEILWAVGTVDILFVRWRRAEDFQGG